jgi:hypothetical protein
MTERSYLGKLRGDCVNCGQRFCLCNIVPIPIEPVEPMPVIEQVDPCEALGVPPHLLKDESDDRSEAER